MCSEWTHGWITLRAGTFGLNFSRCVGCDGWSGILDEFDADDPARLGTAERIGCEAESILAGRGGLGVEVEAAGCEPEGAPAPPPRDAAATKAGRPLTEGLRSGADILQVCVQYE